MITKQIFIAVAATLCFAPVCSNANTMTTITFDGFASTGSGFENYGNSIDIGDYRLTGVQGPGGSSSPSLIFHNESSFLYNGSDAVDVSDSGLLLLSRIDGGNFSVHSVDVDDVYSNSNPGADDPSQVRFTADSGATFTFETDQLSGLQTVNFKSQTGFSGVSSVLFSGIFFSQTFSSGLEGKLSYGGVVDNIVLSEIAPIPLPAALPMLLAGVAGLGFIGRRNRKAKIAV